MTFTLASFRCHDINSLQYWKNVIENKCTATSSEYFLLLAAQHATPAGLNHLAIAYPDMVKAVKESKE